MRMILLCTLVWMLLASCQNEEIDFSRKNQEIKFTLNTSVLTKASGVSFDVGDKIGVYVVRHLPHNSPGLQASGNYAENKCYKVMNGSILEPYSEEDKIYSTGDGYSYSFFAYYPYDAAVSDPTNINFEVSLYQKTLQEVKNSDFMIAQALNMDISLPISLNFKRKLSLLNVVYNKNPEGIIPTIAIHGLSSKCKINLQSGILEAGQNDYSYIVPLYRYAESNKQYFFNGIVPPFNFKDYASFQVDLNGDLSYYTIQNSLPLIEGTSNTIYLTETKKYITCIYANYDGGSGTLSGEGYYVKGRSCTLVAKANEGSFFGGWYQNNVLVSEDPEYTFTVLEDATFQARFHKCYEVTITCNIDTNILKPYLKSITGAGLYKAKEVVKPRVNLLPGSDYVFYAWFIDGKIRSYHWDMTFEMDKDYHLEARFLKVVYDKLYVSEELSFISNNDFDYEFKEVKDVSLGVAPNSSFFNMVYIWFDGELYDFVHYGFFTSKIQIHSSNGNVKYSDSGQVGYMTAKQSESLNIKFQIQMHYGLPGNIPIKGRLHVRTYGYWYDPNEMK